ncbi:uncharacterized protein LOC113634194 [Tachysurus fulvidraco]|uniref:uncharacterized protein LOC113634194 n=1 Tax=Tachysurus fulvidraco TaxID=1234273 RepID=UPI001FEDCD7E|nr:uncharacterized protein LOC113634194 [Tachysurus fulvidraco]
MFSGVKQWILFLSMWHITSITVTGENLCKRELLKSTNVSAELQSDVLLPCNFDPVLLRSDKSADVVVVWRQINTTTHGLLEISQHGQEMYWNYRDGRVKHFPKLSASGNFSILLKKVQPYELGLYTCELYHGTNCSIGYQEIQLGQSKHQWLTQKWPFIAGGAAVALIFLLVFTCVVKRACSGASNDAVYANARFEKRNAKQLSKDKHNCHPRRNKAKKEVCPNNPQNHNNIYANSRMQDGDTYVNKPH